MSTKKQIDHLACGCAMPYIINRILLEVAVGDCLIILRFLILFFLLFSQWQLSIKSATIDLDELEKLVYQLVNNFISLFLVKNIWYVFFVSY